MMSDDEDSTGFFPMNMNTNFNFFADKIKKQEAAAKKKKEAAQRKAAKVAAAQQCENQCKPGGTYNNGSPPAACTAAYCDQYLPGKLLASRCIPGNPGHTYAKSECQSTCNICPK